MIEVQNLTKAFGAVHAVDDVSFTVGKGEILGFLGPNGAGKTTTMRVLTGYLPATRGTARIAGYDVTEQSLEVRRRIGYLPENPPLYPDMSVASYLDFVARIKGVPSATRAGRVDAALEMANITDKKKELIKRLSKGYKQRVGLAQALVHNPDVIILDEPTIGLDPKQIIEVRHLIKSLAGSHTIILSTHILPEVSMTCDRVVIINKGRVVAEDTPDNLVRRLKGAGTTRIEVRGDQASVLEAIRAVPGVIAAHPRGGHDGTAVVDVEAEAGRDVRSELAWAIVTKGHALVGLQQLGMSLEEIFLHLTIADVEEAALAA